MSDILKINNILDLSKTKFSFLFNGLEYPYEVLPLLVKIVILEMQPF